MGHQQKSTWQGLQFRVFEARSGGIYMTSVNIIETQAILAGHRNGS
jgi:hypothetical protein